MESRSIFRVTSMVLMIALSGFLAACGGGDSDEEPTATTEPSSARPTVVASVESTPDELPATPAAPARVAPRNTDMSSPRSESSLVSAPSAQAATPERAGQTSAMATPAGEPVNGTTATPETIAGASSASADDQRAGDGTSGASSGVASSAATPAAPATPVPSASPMASPQPAGEVPVVTSCNVENIPAFTGEVTVYTLTVDLNFREGPGADCDMIGDGPLGEFSVVDVIGGPVEREGDDSGEWVQVEVGDQVGWLALQYLEPAG